MADPVRPLVLIAGAEALAAGVLTVVVGAVSMTGRTSGISQGVVPGATVALWALAVLALGLVTWGLARRRRVAHTPFLLCQAFALVVAWPLVRSGSALDTAAGVVLAGAAVAGLVIGLRPGVREALG